MIVLYVLHFQNVLPALRVQCDDLKAKLEKEHAECRELQVNIESMNIVVREPPPIGNSKVAVAIAMTRATGTKVQIHVI